jgi:acyl carrier protein
LYLGGEGLARGYWQRAELTAERFVPDGLSGCSGERLYRTGDLVKWRGDGELEYLGRLDQQVKVRGYRIELGEVEAELRKHAGIREAVVVVREQEDGDKRLVGYVVLEEGQEAVAGSELRPYLKERLPEYMIPSVFVQLAELPLTANGKVDRRALPEPEQGPAGGEGYVGPRTATEEIVAGIWASVLKLERVGVTENFFEIGGHSLLATQVMSRIRESFAVEMPLRELFEQATVAGLSKRVEETMQSGAGVLAPPIVAVDHEQALPLSFAQQRLWFLDQLEPESAFYNIPSAVRLSGRCTWKR